MSSTNLRHPPFSWRVSWRIHQRASSRSWEEQTPSACDWAPPATPWCNLKDEINSLVPERFGGKFRKVVTLAIDEWGITCEIAVRWWMPLDPTDDKSTPGLGSSKVLVLGTWCELSSTWYLLVLDLLKFKSTWYLLVLECQSTWYLSKYSSTFVKLTNIQS